MALWATSIGPKPSFYFCLFCFSFLLAFGVKDNLFSPKVGQCCLLFSVCLCFSLVFCWTFLFHSLFLCLSLVVFFLPSLFSFLLLSFASLFLHLNSVLFHENNNIKQNSSILSVSWFPGLRCLSNPFFLSLFSYLNFVLCSTSMFHHSKKTSRKKETIFCEVGGCNIFFNNLCFPKCEKLFWGPIFGQVLVEFQKAL